MRDELNQQAVVITTTLMNLIAALAASAPLFGGQDDLWENSRFVMTCVAGSFAGALLIIAMPHPKMTPRKMACEVFFAFLVGLIFSPLVIDRADIPRNTTHVLPASVVVAMMGIGILRISIPLLRALFVDWLINKVRILCGYPPLPPADKPNDS